MRAWRKRNPGYWRKGAGRGPKPQRPPGADAQPAAAEALSHVLAGDALQDRFALFCREVVDRGLRVLGGVGALDAATVREGVATT